MLLLVATTDKLQLVTGAAVTIDVHVSWVDRDNTTGALTYGKTNTAITTAATTDICAAPASGSTRNVKFINIRNKHATLACDVSVLYDQNATDFELHKATLSPGEVLEFVEGVGWFEVANALPVLLNRSIADQAVGVSTTVYLLGSALAIPTTRPLAIGCILKWVITMSKTAAATVALSFDVRYGTAGTTGDTSRFNGSTGTQTAAADVAEVEIRGVVRGPISSSCVVHHQMELQHNLSATGFALIPNVVVQAASAAFDITTAGIIAGLSMTTGALHAITIQQVNAEVQYPG